MDDLETIFASIQSCNSCPEGTIYLIPPVKWVRYKNEATGEIQERLEFNPKAAGMITNIKP
jgi:hypothetical protein